MSGLQREKIWWFGVNKNWVYFLKTLVSVLKCCFDVWIVFVDGKEVFVGLLINKAAVFWFVFVDLQIWLLILVYCEFAGLEEAALLEISFISMKSSGGWI